MNRKQLNSLKESIHQTVLNETIDPITIPDAPADPGWESPLQTWPADFDLDLQDRGQSGKWNLPQLSPQFMWQWDRNTGQWIIINNPNYYTNNPKDPFRPQSLSWEQLLGKFNRPYWTTDEMLN